MSIYRGAGGAGDAVADSSSEALLVRELAIEVQADADAASGSATAAAGSASGAATSATSASNSATAAATSATNASNSASAASTSATNAANSATAAQTAETAAELAETNAETAETNAETAATNAASSASAASTSATNAASSASAASTSATNASNSASAASTSASNASTSATAAAGSASSASTSASNASTSATNAANSATSASGSATTATTQAGIATTKAGEAATSATNAASSASSASTSASTATTQATNASNSASAAATSATNAANSATSASTSATNAANSATAAAASAASINPSSIAITGGSINGTTVGATTPSTGKFTTLEATGVTTVQAGSVSAPAITTTGDTNTGIFFPAADTIAFTEGGVEAMRINSSANVGIGTTNPSGRLQVSGLNDTGGVATFISNASDIGNTTPFIDLSFTQRSNNADGGKIRAGRDGIYSATSSTMDSYMAFFTAINNADTERMRINSDGNVGIGTSSPLTPLHAVGAIQSQRSGAAQYARMLNSAGTATFISDNQASGTYTGFQFQGLSTASGTPVTYATIDGSGNVGIGTSSPVYQTQIYGSGQQTAALTDAGNKGGSLLLNTPTVNAGDGGALLIGAGGSGAKPFAALKGLLTDGGGNTTGALAFSTRNATGDTALTERMRIDASGNVGIGTSSPTARLDVSGGSIRVNEDGAGTKVIQVRSNWAGVDPAINVQTNNPLLLNTNGIERMRILSTGNILSLAGGSTTATGTGIAFPATQSASTDANTLDDYEEGTFNPTIVSVGGSNPTITYGAQQGTYTKIGNRVCFSIYIFISAYSGGSGEIVIGNLPFTSGTGQLQGISVGTAGVDIPTGTTSMTGYVRGSAAQISLLAWGDNIGWVNGATAWFGANDELMVSGTYIA